MSKECYVGVVKGICGYKYMEIFFFNGGKLKLFKEELNRMLFFKFLYIYF